MATIKPSYAGTASITITAPSDGAARESTAVDNSTNLYVDAHVNVKFTAGTVTGNKQALVYAYGSYDGTAYEEVATGSDAAYTMRAPSGLTLLGQIPVPTSSVEYEKIFSVASAFGGILPKKWGIVLQCDGTGTIASLAVNYQGLRAEVA